MIKNIMAMVPCAKDQKFMEIESLVPRDKVFMAFYGRGSHLVM